MACPYLAYRREADGSSFDEARAYCRAADRFVQPMRADICNDRYDLDHERHCEIYREHAGEGGEGDASGGERGTDADGDGDGDGTGGRA